MKRFLPILTVCGLLTAAAPGCGDSGADDTARVLFGFTAELLGALQDDGAGNETETVTCTNDVVITFKEVSLSEDGDVTAVYDASEDKGIAETDADGAPAWGYRSFETCIYPNGDPIAGSIEFSIESNGTYDGRITSQFSTYTGNTLATSGDPIPNSLTFTAEGASERQCFTFTRVDDGVRNTVEDPRVYTTGTITQRDGSGNVVTDGFYSDKLVCDISVTMDDDEAPGVRVSNISNVMEEPGVATPNSGTFRVELRTAPAANVTVPINDTFDSVNAGNREGSATPTSLTFTPANWNTPQIVTVNSVDDLEVDGLKIYTIAVETTSSSDSEYNGLNPRDVVIFNRDQSVPGYSIERLYDSSTANTDSSGGNVQSFATDDANQMGSTYATFRIRLRSKPSANVTMNWSTNCGSRCNLLTTTLTFTDSNWNVYQTVQVEGASDSTNTSNQDYNVTFTASSTDPTYNTTVTEPVFRVRACDNDAANLIHPCNFSGQTIGLSGSRFTQAEGGTSYVWLITQSDPGATTTVNLMSSDEPLGGTVPASVDITGGVGGNYNRLETGNSNRVMMSHANDDAVNSPQNRDWTVTTGNATGGVSDTGANIEDIFARTTDNEEYFYVNRSGNTQEGTATTATISVCLGANNPDEAITINVACSGDECNATSDSSITFPINSQVATANASDNGCPNDTKKQIFTVTGADDIFADGTQSFSVALTMAANGDSNYSGAPNPSNPSVNNLDNEPAGKAIFVLPVTTPGVMTAQGVLGADGLCNSNIPAYAPDGGGVTYRALVFSSSGGEVNDRVLSDVFTAGNYYYRCQSGGGNCDDENQHMFIAGAGGSFNPASMTRWNATSINFPNGTYWVGASVGNPPTVLSQSLTPTQGTGAGQCDDTSTVYRHNCHGWTERDCPTDISGDPEEFYGELWTAAGGDGGTLNNSEEDCANSHRLICVQQ